MHMPGGWQLLIILAVILLLFGAARLPALARSLGQSARVFKGEMKQLRAEDEPSAAQRNDGAADPQTSGGAVAGSVDSPRAGDDPSKPAQP